MYSLTYLNRNFRFVYQPKDNLDVLFKHSLEMKRNDFRFLVGGGQLGKYITPKNAETVLKSLEKMKTDKKSFRFRKYGKLDVYVK